MKESTFWMLLMYLGDLKLAIFYFISLGEILDVRSPVLTAFQVPVIPFSLVLSKPLVIFSEELFMIFDLPARY